MEAEAEEQALFDAIALLEENEKKKEKDARALACKALGIPELRNYQDAAVEKIAENAGGRMTLRVPTGAGKQSFFFTTL